MALSREELQQIEKNWKQGKAKQAEMSTKSNQAPAKNRYVPTLEKKKEIAQKAQDNRDMQSMQMANDLMASQKSVPIQQSLPTPVNQFGGTTPNMDLGMPAPVSKFGANSAPSNINLDAAPSKSLEKIQKENKYTRQEKKQDNRNLSTKPSSKYENKIAGQTKTANSQYDKDFDEFWEYRHEKADFNDYDAATDSAIPHWQNVKKDIMQKNNWDEAEFKKHWEEYDKARSQDEANKEVETMANLGKEHPVLGSIAQRSYLPQTILEGANTVAGAALGRFAPQLLPESASDPAFTGTRVREATKQAIKDNALNSDNELVSKAAKGLYDVGSGFADLGEHLALSGGNRGLLGVMTGLESATRNQMTALERGATPQAAADWGTLAGTTSGVMNSIGLDKAMGAEAKTALGRIGKGALTEGLENIVEDATNYATDKLLNKDNSQLQISHDYYVRQGLTDKEAWMQVAKDITRDLFVSGGSGALFGGIVNGVRNIPELKTEFQTSRDNANYRNQINNLVENNTDEVRPLPALNSDVDVDNIEWGKWGKQPVKTKPAPVAEQTPEVEPVRSPVPEVTSENKSNIKQFHEYVNNKKLQNNIKFDNEADSQAFNEARKGLYRAYQKFRNNPNLENITQVDEHYRQMRRIAEKGYELDNSVRDTYRQMKKDFADRTKGMTIRLSDTDMAEMTDMNFRDLNSKLATLGNNTGMKFRKNSGTPIDTMWDDLVAASGGQLSADVASTQDMVRALVDYVDDLQTKVNNPTTERIPADVNNYIPEEFWDDINDMAGNTNAPANKVMAEDTGLNPRDRAEKLGLEPEVLEEELPWTTPGETPRVDATGETKANSQSSLLDKMDEKYLTDEYDMQQKTSKSVTNSDMRIDPERANELLEKGIGQYWSENHKQQFSDARDMLSKDYAGSLNKYLNNEGTMYSGVDYNAIRILEEDIKAKRKVAIAEGNEELANKYTDQLDKLAETRVARHSSSGAFNEAAKMWINTAEGAVDTAENVAYGALKKMRKGEAKHIEDAANDMVNAANDMLDGNDLWNELKEGERRLKFEHDLYNKIQSVAKEKNINVNDDLVKKLAKDIANGAKSEQIAQEIAAFHEYGFVGISDETLATVEDMFDRAENLPYGSKERVTLETRAYQLLANDIYKDGGSWLDKWNAWRYFAMLSSPGTDIRNIGSTGIFSEVYTRAANALAWAIEGGVDNAVKLAKTGSNKFFGTDLDNSKGIKRTKAFINPASAKDQALLGESWKDATEGAFRWLSGHKYMTNVGMGIDSEKPVFKPGGRAEKSIGKVFNARSKILSGEDFFFKRNKYSTSLTGYLIANGADENIFKDARRFEELERKPLLTKEENAEYKALKPKADLLSDARAYAVKEAQYSTYNTPNNAGKITQATRNMLESNNPVTRFFGRWVEGMLAFKQTPANILKTMYDFSPLSAGTSAKKLLQAAVSKDDTRIGKVGVGNLKLNVGQSTFADAFSQLSKTLTGTGLMMLGAYLHDNGVITSSEDEVTGKSDATQGKQKYSINIDGKSYTADWLGTSGTPLFLGAEAKKLWDKYHDEDDSFWDVGNKIWNGGADEVVNAAMTVVDPVVEMSMLQGFGNTLDNVGYQDTRGGKAVALATSPILSYYSQGIPTVLGKVTKTADNTRRSLRTNREGIAGTVERSVRQAMNKVPGFEKKNMPYVDMWGETQNNLDASLPARTAYQLLSPSYVQELKTEPYQAEIDRLYKETGNADVIHQSFPNKIDGERLNNEEYFKAQTAAGKLSQDLINATLNNSQYKSLDADTQVEVQKKLAKLAYEVGVHTVRPDKKISDDVYNAYGKNGNINEAVNNAIESAKTTAENNAIKELGVPPNETTKAMYEHNDTASLNKYKLAESIAKRDFDRDSITETQWKIYDTKGDKAFREELKYEQLAKGVGLDSATDGFKAAIDSGMTPKQYADEDNLIKSIQVGTDEYGDPEYLEHNKTTSQIYRDYGEDGLRDYATITKAGGTKDTFNAFRLYTKRAKSTSALPTLDPEQYMSQVAQIEKYNKDGKTNGEVSMQELVDWMNAKGYSLSTAQAYWDAYFDNGYKVYTATKGKSKGRIAYKNPKKK